MPFNTSTTLSIVLHSGMITAVHIHIIPTAFDTPFNFLSPSVMLNPSAIEHINIIPIHTDIPTNAV